MRDEHGTTRLSWSRLRIAFILGTSVAGLVFYWSSDALAALVPLGFVLVLMGHVFEL